MQPLQEMSQVFNRLFGSRSLVRRGVRGRRRWAAEALEMRTLLTMPLYFLQTGSDNPTVGLAQGPGFLDVQPTLVDLDADNDLDLVVGRLHGISYFENVGNASTPSFTERTAALNPFSSVDTTLQTAPAPALADWDADGDLDLLWGSISTVTGLGELSAYENTGSASAPSFAALGPGNPFDRLFNELALPPVPAFADMDGDHDLDLVVSRLELRMRYYKNVGNSTSPAYVSSALADPFTPVSLGFLGSPALGDVDGDGDADLVAASFLSESPSPVRVRFFENTGSATQANLTDVTGEVFNDQFSIHTARTAPALGDLDGDGDQDLLLALDNDPLDNGLPGERFRYYEAVENPRAFKPKNTVPGFQLAKEDIAVVFSVANGNAISVADPNADGSELQVTLTVDQGELTLATTAGLNFAFSDAQGTGAGDGINDATMTFRGTRAEINAALDGLEFQPTLDFSGVATLTITSNDLGQPGGGAALSDTDWVPISVHSGVTQVEQLQLQITLLVDLSGLNQGAANALLHLLNLTGNPHVDAIRINVFMNVVQVFGRAGIFTDEGTDLFLIALAQDILVGITTRAP